jgi:hypothetical protein
LAFTTTDFNFFSFIAFKASLWCFDEWERILRQLWPPPLVSLPSGVWYLAIQQHPKIVPKCLPLRVCLYSEVQGWIYAWIVGLRKCFQRYVYLFPISSIKASLTANKLFSYLESLSLTNLLQSKLPYLPIGSIIQLGDELILGPSWNGIGNFYTSKRQANGKSYELKLCHLSHWFVDQQINVINSAIYWRAPWQIINWRRLIYSGHRF